MSTLKFHLFHSIDINSEENATVRRLIVEKNLKDQIEFHNVAYEGSQKLFAELSGQKQTPCLVADKKVFVGAAAITKFLTTIE